MSTPIEWTDETWNPTRGCLRVSAGCKNCYAERQAARFAGPGGPYEGLVYRKGAVIPRAVDRPDRTPWALDTIAERPRWTGVGRFVPTILTQPLKWRAPKRVFVNSMSDLFFEAFTNQEIAAVFGVMAAAPQHTFQVLTKRPERAVEWFKWLEELVEDDAQRCVEFNLVNIHFARAQCAQLKCWELARDAIRSTGAAIDGSVWDAEMMSRETFRWPLPNVWLGVSVEHQDAAEERISHLLLAPAAIRFLSCEPLLGEIDLPMVQAFGAAPGVRIDWVIAGCESGPGARLCKVNWLRSLRDQCEDGGVPFFLKQATRVRTQDEPQLQVGDVHPVVEGKRSTVKGNVIGAPYLDGEQWLMFPTPKEKTEHE